jgi:hypothetical protein
MPLDPDAIADDGATLHATRLIVAARGLGDGVLEDRLLRALRIHAMAGGEMDAGTLESLAREHGAPSELFDAAVSDQTEADVRADMATARAPSGVAHALGRRLGGGGTRYSTPSYVLETDQQRFELVGIHPFETHEAVLANLVPQLERRDPPASVEEALAWAGGPLATAELAAVLGTSAAAIAETTDRDMFRPAGLDGYWELSR